MATTTTPMPVVLVAPGATVRFMYLVGRVIQLDLVSGLPAAQIDFGNSNQVWVLVCLLRHPDCREISRPEVWKTPR